jgi:hypothetical protein
VGTRKQLFLDDSIVEQMSGLRRVPHHPRKHPANPIVRGEYPWERGVLHPIAVARDAAAGTFHLWYRATSAPPGQPARESLCYARSRDGVRWEKPRLSLVQLSQEEGGTPNNLLPLGRTPVAVFIRPDEPDPSRRFLGFFSGEKPASVAPCYSADGLQWTIASQSGDLRGAPNTPPNANARYFYTGQCWAGRNAWGAGRRGAMRADTEDLERWGGNMKIFAAGPEDPENLEFYTMSVADMRTAHTYHGFHLGFLHHFHTDLGGKRNPANNVAMSGTIDVYLVASRDSVTWWRVDKEKPFLPLGPGGAFDSGMVFLCSMVECKDRLLFYYNGWNVEHGELIGTPSKEGRACIGAAALRLDGFVSLEPQGAYGTMTTRPFLCAGDELLVNADARRGKLVVEALDENGRPQPGFSAADCQPVAEDSLRARVQWRQRALSALRGHVIRLRFVLHGDAALYAFQVAPAGR